MEETSKKRFHIDWVLVVTIALVAAFGLIMVYSASFVRGYDQLEGNYTYFFERQLMWLVVSCGLFLFLMFFPYRHFRKLTPLIMLGSVVMLILVKTPLGIEVNGAQRWIGAGGFRIQPSEFVKLGVIVYLAYVYSKKQAYINDLFKGLLPPLVVVGFLFGLIMLQPDLGTATSIVAVAGLIVFVSGARLLHLTWIGGLGAIALVYYARSAEYRMNRIIGFRDPFELGFSDGYQLIQSYIAIAHGGVTGAGLGQSVQKLFYLPEAHTDFILAIVSEELGLLGILFVFACMVVIILRGVVIGARCRDAFGSLLAFGIVFQMAIQILFNAGAVSGLLPITGIPFPLLSYGGSSLMVTFMSLGILANISRKTEKERSERLDRESVYDDAEQEVAATSSNVTPLRPVRQFTR
ncbi:putative lipid II flippase FtsW [Alteribacter keqinensis]|uniref:Probable peptidoglycan glycosyltransferase FtsW n=1 Tax=Alteribacter keqinensis TaxID=2483800 RepID=A0A3M7TYQ6_9BACI|nr:putative lipid II flippase FtsW [Alteribacter keqinensis]RNA70411.1 putative lipid II flippase FtsW [Alteribacter keqinensis]